MKIFLKNIGISLVIAFLSFYMVFIINGKVLYNDLYAQGLPFLEYFKNQFSITDIFSYNWNMGLGDSTFSFIIYYLLSPFNILLIPFKSFDMVDILPIFLTIKVAFIVYFSSLYFKKVVGNKYKWIGAIIYLASYNIIMYGSIHIMWIDTFIFLPIVLLGIEKILNREKSTIYVASLFFVIITNYYLAALLIIHIGVYGVIRYIYLNGKHGVFRFIGKMIGLSIISGLLSGFVLIPALGYMLNSSKDVNSTLEFTNSFSRLLDVFKANHIGIEYSGSNTYITLLGLISIIPFLIFNKNKKEYLYLIPVLLLLFGVFSDRINFMLNLGYEACGGNYRYNLLLNIYIGIIICSGLDSLVNGSRKKLSLILIIGVLYIILAVLSPEILSLNSETYIINIVFVILYTLVIGGFLFGKRENIALILLTLLLISEVLAYNYFISRNRDFVDNSYAKDIKSIVNYVGKTYGKGSRIEINDAGGVYNTYLSQNIPGVEGFYSLMISGYRKAGDVFTDTAYMKVINRLGGRNIVTRFTGEKYFASPYNYCPYIGSNFLEKKDNYYIFSLPNKDIKYFDSVTSTLDNSMIKKDYTLYNKLYIEGSKKDKIEDYRDLVEYPINNKEFTVKENGEYYLSLLTAPPNEYTKMKVKLSINGVLLEDKGYFSKKLDYANRKSEVYIGYLKKGDEIKLYFELGDNPKVVKIDEKYINNANSKMNSIENQKIVRKKNRLQASFTMNNKGYAVLPVIYDSSFKITDNGRSINPSIVNGGFIGLNLESGKHNIEIKYNPYSIYIGCIISLVTLFTIIVYNYRKYIFKNNYKY